MFPAPTRATSGLVNNVLTTVTLIAFSDKLLVTITAANVGPSHWCHVPLAHTDMETSRVDSSNDENALLPRADLTATTVLGGTKEEQRILGETLATNIASAILVKRPQEERMLVLGLGLKGSDALDRKAFEEVVGLVLDVL